MRKRITYANIAATLALVFSMTGGALAANHYLISSTKQISPKVLKKLRGNTGRKGATGAAGAAGLTGKEGPAGKESTAALTLGGIPAAGYTRNDCVSKTGQIKGYAVVPEGLPGTLTTVANAYNCSGEAVQARKIAVGEYEVQFQGNPETIATGSVNDRELISDDAFVSFSQSGAGKWTVYLYNVVLKAPEDRPFSVIVP